jgi:hypothetical protein
LVAPIVPRGSPGRMQLLTDDVCVELLMPGSAGIFAEAFGLGATSWRIDRTRCEVDANGHFQASGSQSVVKRNAQIIAGL